MADVFTRTPRRTRCFACGEPCNRMFRKTKDGRPWPENISLCVSCVIAWCNATRSYRIEQEQAKLAAEREAARPSVRSRPLHRSDDAPEVSNG
jgi:hypothetical protein